MSLVGHLTSCITGGESKQSHPCRHHRVLTLSTLLCNYWRVPDSSSHSATDINVCDTVGVSGLTLPIESCSECGRELHLALMPPCSPDAGERPSETRGEAVHCEIRHSHRRLFVRRCSPKITASVESSEARQHGEYPVYSFHFLSRNTIQQKSCRLPPRTRDASSVDGDIHYLPSVPHTTGALLGIAHDERRDL